MRQLAVGSPSYAFSAAFLNPSLSIWTWFITGTVDCRAALIVECLAPPTQRFSDQNSLFLLVISVGKSSSKGDQPCAPPLLFVPPAFTCRGAKLSLPHPNGTNNFLSFRREMKTRSKKSNWKKGHHFLEPLDESLLSEGSDSEQRPNQTST